ncbi:hypothetical protein RDI58_017673 [Solanum bulbocastanum]|uniref:Uncharacterized protein n=1 Tax=Solanum bulbocastanum TaxID=147425 RepID=A0AAN8TCR8_SOLBU
MNPPSMCTDTSTVKRSCQSQSTGRGRGRGYFATNATGRGRGRDNAQPTNNGSTQPTTRTKKPKQSTSFGIYTNIQSGGTVLNEGKKYLQNFKGKRVIQFPSTGSTIIQRTIDSVCRI